MTPFTSNPYRYKMFFRELSEIKSLVALLGHAERQLMGQLLIWMRMQKPEVNLCQGEGEPSLPPRL